jgi:mono/diheme cytochrome c family protein
MTRPTAARAILGWVGAMALGAGYLHLQAARVHDVSGSPDLHALAAPTQAPDPVSRTAAASPRAVLDEYCVVCHNERLKTAGLLLDTLKVEDVGERADVWEKVARKFRTHEMPPPGRPRPDRATYAAMSSWLETALDAAAAARPNPGRVAVHRLNRVEYTNAVRDLLDLEVDTRSLLSADQTDQQSFDNMASVLSVSPSLLEGYLSASRRVSRLAMGDPTIGSVIETYKVPRALVQDVRTGDDLPFGSQGGAVIRHVFPLDGDYTIKAVLKRELYSYLMGMGEAHQFDFRIDGMLLKRIAIGGEGKGRAAPESFVGYTQGDPEWELYMQTADAVLEVRVPVRAGLHEVAVSFVEQPWEPEGVLQPDPRHFAQTINEDYHGHPGVDAVMIGGPYQSGRDTETASRRKIFVCYPKTGGEEEPCARKILSSLAARAYRRPVTAKDLQRLLSFYQAGHAEGGFESGVQEGLRRILASPSFLFRVEQEPPNLAPGTAYRLSDFDLASRLSFFLWSSIPDAQLLDLAARGELAKPPVLRRQIRRMLADKRASALVTNFANQWLKIGRIAGVVPDADVFPDFDDTLRDAMQKETQLLIESQLREDRSVMDLLTANYTFVNERLAKHYGMPHIYGSHFRRAPVANEHRIGLLAHASVLTVTSYPNRTSPVLRGRWLLENMLGSPPPPPPPDVPALEENEDGERPTSVRERMEAHRRNPVCAACHVRMDPLGFSLENFDALGQWREVADGLPVDTLAALPDGTRFQGINGLRNVIAGQKREFVRTFTERLMAYALGRGIEYYDLPTVRAVEKNAAATNYRWSSIIEGIVTSRPFTMGIVREASAGTAARNSVPQ